MKLKLLFLFALLMASLTASLTYTSNQTATYKVGAQTVASVQLLNTLIYPNGVSTLGKDSIDGTPGCGPDLKTAKVCLAITPSITRTLTSTSKITAKVSNSLKGTVGGSGITIYEARNKTYQNAIISQAPTGQLDTNGTGIMTSFISGYFNNTIERTDWYPLDLNGYTIQSGKKYVIGLDYIRTDTSDVADLVPGIFTDDATAWAYWNSSWPINRNCTVNASTADNMTFLARCTFTGLNSTTINQTTCTDPRFLVTGVDTAPRPYILSSNFSTYCGIGNATYFIPVNGSRGTTINIEGYFGNTGAASGENGPAVCSLMNISNMYIANFDENTTARDRCGVHNLTRSNTGCTVQNTKGFYPGFTYNLTGNCNWNKTVGTGLSGVCNGNMACYEYALIHLNGAGYSSQGPWQIGAPNLNYRLVYFQTAAQTTDNYASINNAFAWAPDSNLGWNSIMDNYDQTNMHFSVANLSSNRTGSAAAAPAPTTNNSFISIGNSGGVIAYYAGYIQMVIYGTSNYSRSLAVGQINQTFVITNALVSPPGTETLTFTNSTVSHSFFVNASSTRSPGLTNYTLFASQGACVQVSNQTTSGASWVYSNCTGPAMVQATIQYNYTLSDGSTFNVSGNNTYPNQAPTTPSAPSAAGFNFTCSPNATTNGSTDADGDQINLTWYESTDGGTGYVLLGTSSNNSPWFNGYSGNLSNGSSIIIRLFATDGFSNSSNATSGANTIIHYAALDTHTANQNTFYTYPYTSILNISSCFSPTINLTIAGMNGNATTTSVPSQYNSTTTPSTPNPGGNTSASYNVSWYFLLNSTSYWLNYTITVSPAGIFACGGLTNTTALNITIRDFVSHNLINTTYTSIVSGSNQVQSATATNYSWCILPTNATLNATFSETYVASGYASQAQSRTLTLSNLTQNVTIYLFNSTGTRVVQISVRDNTNAPVANSTVGISALATNGSYLFIGNFPTGPTATFYTNLVVSSQIYLMNVSSQGGSLLATYPPAPIIDYPYNSYDTVLLIVNYGTGVGYISTYNTTSASCIYNNVSRVLTCTPTGPVPQNTELTLYNVNISNSSLVCDNFTSGATPLACTVSSTPSCYNYVFNATMPVSSGERPVLATGQICTYAASTFNFGILGLLIAFIITGVFALLGLAFGPIGVLWGAAFGLLISSLIPGVLITTYGATVALAIGLIALGWLVK